MEEYDYTDDFEDIAREIEDEVVEKFTEPLMYRDERSFRKDLVVSAFSVPRYQFINDFLEIGEEYDIEGPKDSEISLLYTYLRGGTPYECWQRKRRFPEKARESSEYVDHYDSNYEEAVRNLGPETIIHVYHGTDPGTCRQFINEGTDLDVPPLRENFPETYEGKIVREPGLYVTTSEWVARGFGSCVLSMNVRAKDLKAIWQERFLWGTSEPTLEERLESPLRKAYPDSFYPELTKALLGDVEPQAFLKKSVDIDDIEDVIYWGERMAPKDFMEKGGSAAEKY